MVVLGVSEYMHGETQLEQFAMAWGSATAEPEHAVIASQLVVRIIGPHLELTYQME